MDQTLLNQISLYWYVPGVATLLISGVSYLFDKFGYNEKDFLNDCKLTKDQNLSKKAKLLSGFVDRVKSNFDNAQAIQEDTYISFLGDMIRHHSYDMCLDKIRSKFKFSRSSLLVTILASVLSFWVGWFFTNFRIYLSVLNIVLVILAIVILFVIRNLGNKLDNLRNEPNLLS
ncbi:MAG: hypothetical protein PHU56_01775 [Candidatus Pacebacteria bacterium]|nr:hypothetical protein [Candidatus Paceibacterota bacterium]